MATEPWWAPARLARVPAAKPFVIDGARTLTYGELATLVQAAPPDASGWLVIEATPSIDTVVAIVRALAWQVPVALLHHRQRAAVLAAQRAQLQAHPPAIGDACVLFTSGSTGAPKGVVHSYGSLGAVGRQALAQWQHAPQAIWHDGDAWLLALSMAQAGGLAVVLRMLALTGTIALAGEGALRDAVAQLRPTFASLVPTQAVQLLDAPAEGWASLRMVLLGGAPATPQLLARARQAGLPLCTSYGATETLGQVATMPLAMAHAASGVGQPLAEVRVAAPACPQPGLIAVHAPTLFTRYLHEPGGTVHTQWCAADLGCVDERGTLHVHGRNDELINTGGVKVFPAALEAVLAATPGVLDICVVPRPSATWGNVIGVACVVDASFVLAQALATWHQALASHERPRQICVVKALPLTASGKVARQACVDLTPWHELTYG